MIKKLIHKLRLYRVVKELPYYVGRDLGVKKRYNPKSLKRIYKRYRFHPNYLPYAFATLSDEKYYLKQFGEQTSNSYQSLRDEIAKAYFKNNSNFTFSDLMCVTRFKGKIHSETDHGAADVRWSFKDSARGSGDGFTGGGEGFGGDGSGGG